MFLQTNMALATSLWYFGFLDSVSSILLLFKVDICLFDTLYEMFFLQFSRKFWLNVTYLEFLFAIVICYGNLIELSSALRLAMYLMV